jgi:predicted  nucleic acid-binding Zn-ribbon protein
MEQQITLLAKLAAVDAQLDELHDELGDLPAEVKKHELIVRERTVGVEQTQAALRDLEEQRGKAHVSLQELTDKEQRLTEQQFQVKNNREFDAITHELEHIRQQRTVFDEVLRTSGVREENLQATLAQQQASLAEAVAVLKEKEAELEALSGDQNEELRSYIALRLRLIAELDDNLEAEYERIRTFHREAAVPLRRSSCSGCYSAIPSQRVMEMKYNRDKLYTCESCGRILFPEDLTVDVESLMEG